VQRRLSGVTSETSPIIAARRSSTFAGKAWKYKLSLITPHKKNSSRSYSVTIKFPKWGHKNHTKIFINTITQYSSRPFPHNVYIAHTTNRTPKKTLLPLSPSVLSSQSVGSMKQPRISSLGVVARSKAWNDFACSNTGVMCSNQTRGMDVRLRLFCVCVALYR
jgi:hypothetical protein